MNITVYTDGACSGNPGPGGWAAVRKTETGKRLYVAGYEKKATNNSMELRAAIGAVQAVKKPRNIIIYTDSNYLITCWTHGKDWLLKEGRPNKELWFQLIQETEKGKHTVEFIKVSGHSGNELNELADKLAKEQIVKARHSLLKG